MITNTVFFFFFQNTEYYYHRLTILDFDIKMFSLFCCYLRYCLTNLIEIFNMFSSINSVGRALIIFNIKS